MLLSDYKKITFMGGMGTKVVHKNLWAVLRIIPQKLRSCVTISGTINIPPSSKAMFCSPSSVMVTSPYSGGSRNFETGYVVPARYRFLGSGDCFDAFLVRVEKRIHTVPFACDYNQCTAYMRVKKSTFT